MKHIQSFVLGIVLCLTFTPAVVAYDHVSLLTSDISFKTRKTTMIDFSAVSCCRILTTNYAGVTFLMDMTHGWATYQANGFATNLSGAPLLPGAPTGMTGTHMTLAGVAKKVGAYIQSGSPFNPGSARTAKSLTIKAYDKVGEKIFDQQTTTCAGSTSPCTPQFLGVRSNKADIKAVEYIINDPSAWSMDNLKWER